MARREDPAQNLPACKQCPPDAQQVEQQQHRAQRKLSNPNQHSHGQRKHREPQMLRHKIGVMRKQRRIERVLDPRRVKPAIFCKRMVAMHQKRAAGQDQKERRPFFPAPRTRWSNGFTGVAFWGVRGQPFSWLRLWSRQCPSARRYRGSNDTIKAVIMRKISPRRNSFECKGPQQRALMECTCDA